MGCSPPPEASVLSLSCRQRRSCRQPSSRQRPSSRQQPSCRQRSLPPWACSWRPPSSLLGRPPSSHYLLCFSWPYPRSPSAPRRTLPPLPFPPRPSSSSSILLLLLLAFS